MKGELARNGGERKKNERGRKRRNDAEWFKIFFKAEGEKKALKMFFFFSTTLWVLTFVNPNPL